MSIEAVQGPGIHDEVAPFPPIPPAGGAVTGVAFGTRVAEGLQEVNRQLLSSQGDLQQLAVGEAQNLHEVLVRLEESRTALQLLLQVRNRVLEAYQDVMRMQV
jgi:flagellar hook-basal body complex protein FliE